MLIKQTIGGKMNLACIAPIVFLLVFLLSFFIGACKLSGEIADYEERAFGIRRS